MVKKTALFCFCTFLSFYALAQFSSTPTAFENVACFLKDCSDIRNRGKIEFGFLNVPENRQDPDSRLLKLAVVILRAKSSTPQPDPVIYLNGGPGAKTLESINLYKNHYLRQHRDIILLDFRGIGYSEPSICPDLSYKIFELLAQNLNPEQEIKQKNTLYQDCLNDLKEQDIDLSAYNTASIAADVRDLCKALGYQSWNLYGISHGTRIALAMMRDYPEGIRAVILDSSAPQGLQTLTEIIPNFERTLNLIFENCENDAQCAESFPKLKSDFYATLQKLEKEPIKLSISGTGSHGSIDFYVNAQDFAIILHQVLYGKTGYSSVPWLIKAFKEDNKAVLSNLFAGLPEQLSRVNWGIQMLVNHYDLSHYQSRATYQQKAGNFPLIQDKLSFFESDLEVFKHWDIAYDVENENIPVESDIPTLILAGEMDPVTPPENGKYTQRYLPNSYFFEIPFNGHGVTVADLCAKSVTEQFIATPTQQPLSECLASVPPIKFQTEVYENGHFFNLLEDVFKRYSLFFVIGFAFAFIISISAILGWPIMLVMDKLRKRPQFEQVSLSARWTASITFLMSFGFLMSLTQFTIAAARENSFMLLFGLPVPSTMLFIIPYLLLFGTTGMVFFTIQAWKKLWWRLGGRIHYSLLTGVSIALMFFFYYYKLFL